MIVISIDGIVYNLPPEIVGMIQLLQLYQERENGIINQEQFFLKSELLNQKIKKLQ
jgi:hypothetical protein